MGKCGTCKYNRPDVESGDNICSNVDSDYLGLETEYDECCFDYEPKDGEEE